MTVQYLEAPADTRRLGHVMLYHILLDSKPYCMCKRWTCWVLEMEDVVTASYGQVGVVVLFLEPHDRCYTQEFGGACCWGLNNRVHLGPHVTHSERLTSALGYAEPSHLEIHAYRLLFYPIYIYSYIYIYTYTCIWDDRSPLWKILSTNQ